MQQLLDRYKVEIKQDSIVAVAKTAGRSAVIYKGRVVEIRPGQYDTRFKMAWINSDGTTGGSTTWITYSSSRIIVLES